ncbi:hypothetical protein H4582DRAFT_2059973 [Lactarius indigo]|nr:hypothetical protein H4582DRAFT_2059973 [Lactarius indigo]
MTVLRPLASQLEVFKATLASTPVWCGRSRGVRRWRKGQEYEARNDRFEDKMVEEKEKEKRGEANPFGITAQHKQLLFQDKSESDYNLLKGLRCELGCKYEKLRVKIQVVPRGRCRQAGKWDGIGTWGSAVVRRRFDVCMRERAMYGSFTRESDERFQE